MLRWLLIIVLSLLVFGGLLRPWLLRIGLGRLPGDFELRIGQRRIWLPVATTLLLSVVAMLIGQLL
jgi:hypothetical protein